jgi:hypothetical protein
VILPILAAACLSCSVVLPSTAKPALSPNQPEAQAGIGLWINVGSLTETSYVSFVVNGSNYQADICTVLGAPLSISGTSFAKIKNNTGSSISSVASVKIWVTGNATPGHTASSSITLSPSLNISVSLMRTLCRESKNQRAETLPVQRPDSEGHLT